MATNCDPACLVLAPTFTQVGCDPKSAVRSGYIKKLIFTRCDVTIIDITDEVEIQSYLTAETMFVTPELTGEVPLPTFGDEITENCQTPIALKRTWALTATSVRTDVDGMTDFTSYDQIDQSLGTWFMTWVDCEDNIFVPQEFTTGGELGWQTNGQISPIWDNSSAMKWQIDLTWNYDRIPKGIKLTDAVADVLGL